MKVYALINRDPFTRSRVVPQGTPGAEEFESEEAYKAWVDAQPPLATAELPVPESVSRRQLFLWLTLDRGVPDADEAIAGQIALLPDGETKRRAQIEFKTATEFRRDNPFVAQIGAALGLTPPEIDAGFILAASKYP